MASRPSFESRIRAVKEVHSQFSSSSSVHVRSFHNFPTFSNAMTSACVQDITVEEHVALLFEKLENLREAREATAALGRRFNPPVQTEIRTLEFWRAIIAECIAGCFLVFIICAAVTKPEQSAADTTVYAALATGLGMAVLVHCFSKISGGHVNPVVTLAYMATKKISPLRAIMFILAQCGGAIGGAALLYSLTPPMATTSGPTLNIGSWERFGVEFVLTFIAVFTQISTAERKFFHKSPLLIGAAYTACSLFPGAMLNPARALGPTFVMNRNWESHWVYWFGPGMGGIVSGIIFEYIFNTKRNSRPKDSIDGDSSSIQSEEEHYGDGKYHPAAYRPVAPNPTSPNGMYCPSEASASRYSAPPTKGERAESIYGGKSGRTREVEGIYSGSRSLYNARIETKSPPLTRANLNRSQSVYAKASQNPRELLPRPGPLVPAQSLYPIKVGGHLSANIRDFAPADGNFIAGIKTEEGNYLKIGNGMVAGAGGFLTTRVGSKSYHDIAEPDKPNAAHVTNQNLQNQLLGGKEKENVYGMRGSPPGGVYPTTEPPRQQTSMMRTAAYVKSVQNHKPRESNYDIVPSGAREVPGIVGYQKPHNRSETSDYGSNRSEGSFTHQQHHEKLEGKPDHSTPIHPHPHPPPPPGNHPPQMRLLHNKMAEPMTFIQPPRHSPLSSVSSTYTRNSPNPPYPPPPPQ